MYGTVELFLQEKSECYAYKWHPTELCMKFNLVAYNIPQNIECIISKGYCHFEIVAGLC